MARSQYALPEGRGHDPRGLEPYIREAAKRNGIDPDVAVRVAKSEGLRDFSGDGGKSGGAFQLYTGGGLGNEFQKATGLDPLDPKNEKATIDYAMQQAAKTGWGPWHGAKKVGIGEREGIGGASQAPADGDGKIPQINIGPPPASTDTAQTGYPSPLSGSPDQGAAAKANLQLGVGDLFAGLGTALSGAGKDAAAAPARPVPIAPTPPQPQVVPTVDPKTVEAQRQQLAMAMQRLNAGAGRLY